MSLKDLKPCSSTRERAVHSWPRTNTAICLQRWSSPSVARSCVAPGASACAKWAVICSTALSRLGSASCGNGICCCGAAPFAAARSFAFGGAAPPAAAGAAALAPPRPKRSRIDDMPPAAAAAPTALVPPAPESRRPLPSAKLVAECPCDARLGIADARRPADAWRIRPAFIGSASCASSVST